MILLKDKYRHALTRLGVRIIGARFAETIHLRNAELQHELWLDGSLLEQGANFRRLRSTSMISLSGSKVAGALQMDELHVDQSLFMGRTAEFGDVDLRGAHIGGSIDLNGATVTGTLVMNALHVGQSVFMREGANYRDVDLRSARIGGQLDLSGSKFSGTVDMDSLHVDGNLYMRDEAEFRRVILRSARLGGQLVLRDSKITGLLNMNALHVEQSLLMSDEAELGDVNLSGARIGGQLDLSGSKVTGALDMDSLQVASDVFLGRGAEFEGPIYLDFSKAGGNVELAGGLFRDTVDLTGAQIRGELRLGSSQHKPARWWRDVTLILRNANAGALEDLSESWPDKIDLNGFTYRSLGGIGVGEKEPMLGRPVEWFESWLARQEPYTPTPYRQLSAVLRDEGNPDAADEILYASKERERAQSRFLSYIELTASKWFIGYGYHLFTSVYWALGFLVAGNLALWLSGEGRRISRHYNILYGITYSFDLLLPIIRLREKHYQIDLRGWVRYYFYMHRVMGYVLASFLIAGISGLTK
jgi:uncharacterized protein YjbI with pentapeptide repeats